MHMNTTHKYVQYRETETSGVVIEVSWEKNKILPYLQRIEWEHS